MRGRIYSINNSPNERGVEKGALDLSEAMQKENVNELVSVKWILKLQWIH